MKDFRKLRSCNRMYRRTPGAGTEARASRSKRLSSFDSRNPAMQARKTVAALAIVAAFAGGAAATYYTGQPAHAALPATPAAIPGAPGAVLPDFASIAQAYGPAVVNI